MRRESASPVSISELGQQYLARIALMSELAGGGVTKVEFAWLSEATSEAHEKCVEARERLFKHTKEHGC